MSECDTSDWTDTRRFLSERVVEDRVLGLGQVIDIPDDAVEALSNDWNGDGSIWLGKIEDWLETLPSRLAGLSARQWASACLRVCPELYAEPPRPLKSSDATPRSKAKIAALTRRAESGCSLWHPLDTQGVNLQQTLFGTTNG